MLVHGMQIDEEKYLAIDQEIRTDLTKLAVESIQYVGQEGSIFHRELSEKYGIPQHDMWKILWRIQQDLVLRIQKAGGF